MSRVIETRRDRLLVSAQWTHQSRRTNGTQLDYQYRVYCEDDYYSQTCTKKCTPRNDRNLGHYFCGTDGEIVCREGWTNVTNYCSTGKSIYDGHRTHCLLRRHIVFKTFGRLMESARELFNLGYAVLAHA